MKKIVTVIALALVCSGAYAQFNQGRILAGGGLGFAAATHKYEAGSTSGTQGKSTTFTFDPKVGYFVIDNLAVGLGVDITSTTTKADGSSNKNSNSTFTVGPFVRYYVQPGIFFQGSVGFGGETVKEADGNTTVTTKYGAFNWDLGVGYAYFLNDFVAIEPMVLYGVRSQKDKEDDIKYTQGGVAIQIGLQVYLGPRN